jgi:asparagine synthase (glutamine-hydrolysing)
MCGIAGILHDEVRPSGAVLARMTEALAHRGPDDVGHVALRPGVAHPEPAGQAVPTTAAEVFLGHRRLSIVDLGGSRQPLRNEDGTVWTVFNGEIYNHRELAADLRSRGHVLRDAGDTEVLVHLWEEHGEAMAERLVGMFAFAIYDTVRATLFLARDRFGQKPLHYRDHADGFAFASELHAFHALPGFSAETDPVALAQYFRYGFIAHPRTAFREIRTLPPGQVLVRRAGTTSVRPYWRPRVTGETDRLDLDELQEHLDRAVRPRLMSDVPLGAFLSGGIDSGLVAASMSRALPAPVQTFTIASGHPWFDEAEAARRTATHLRCDHHEFLVEPDLATISETLARHYGQPFADHSAIPTYLVSRESRRHVTVALSGDGGDELFAGYGSYRNHRRYRLLGLLPRPVRQALAAATDLLPGIGPRGHRLAESLAAAFPLPAKGENHAHLFHQARRQTAFQPEFSRLLATTDGEEADRFTAYWREAAGRHAVDRWLEVDQRLYLCDDLMAKVDTASMAVSLECRSPFLDHRLAEYANRLSWRVKLAGGITKAPLRALAARQLPPDIAGLPKKGFSLPLGDWLRNSLRPWAEAAIFGDADPWLPYLRPEAVERLWREHQASRADHAMRLWTIIALGLWRRTLPAGKPR